MSEIKFPPPEVIKRDTEQCTVLPDLASLQPGERRGCIYNGVNLELELTVDSISYDVFLKRSSSKREYNVSCQGEKILYVTLEFHYSIPKVNDMNDVFEYDYLDVPSIITSIEKRDTLSQVYTETMSHSLRGLGREVYARMLDEVQRMVNILKKTAIHEVRHVYNMGLTPEKWNAVFVEILVARGYIKKRDGLWYKTYTPDKGSVT